MSRKKLLYVGACVVLVLVLGSFIALGVYNRQQEQKLAKAKKDVQQTVLSYNFDAQKPEALEESLLTLTGQIRDKTVHTNAPGQAEFEHQSADIQHSITYLTQVSNYSNKVGALLAGQQFGGKFISKDDALKQAAKWQAFNDALKKDGVAVAFVRKPHDVLVASTAAQVAIANKASEAYKANDSAGLAAQTKAANDELAKIKAVYDDIYALVRAQQAYIIVTTNKL